MEHRLIQSDILIIGGGTAGCYAASILGQFPSLSVTVVEKANIQRSGCLAAGVNAINAYITKGQTPQDMVDYATRDGKGIVRTDLLLTVAQQLNEVTQDLERLGLVFLKDEQGAYVARGLRNIKINGENIKPILAAAAQGQKNVSVFNHVNVTDLIQTEDGIGGAYGFSVSTPIFYEFRAKAVMIATGGAAGLYRPNNAGFSRHKMWYPPFNTGAGYAMGIRAGAEMTTFEMRFVALRCKDTIAPVGTIAQGVSARQVNALGENYEKVYGLATDERVYGTTAEQLAGRGPCYLRTKGITEEQVQDLYKAYLNMAPSQTLKWLESGTSPAEQSVEIAGTEPYIVGGHCASGYWVDTKRMTTLKGLFAAGDVAGGCPQKFVSGALVEGKIAALSAKDYCSAAPALCYDGEQAAAKLEEYQRYLRNPQPLFCVDDIEEAMQKIMDEYAGGLSSHYAYNENGLKKAKAELLRLERQVEKLSASDMDDLLRIYELKERFTVCQVVIAHLLARQETRWNGYGINQTYPNRDDAHWSKYVNSRMEQGEIKIILRDLVKGGAVYEHSDQSK